VAGPAIFRDDLTGASIHGRLFAGSGWHELRSTGIFDMPFGKMAWPMGLAVGKLGKRGALP